MLKPLLALRFGNRNEAILPFLLERVCVAIVLLAKHAQVHYSLCALSNSVGKLQITLCLEERLVSLLCALLKPDKVEDRPLAEVIPAPFFAQTVSLLSRLLCWLMRWKRC